MDLGTILITLVFIAIVTVPFVLTGYSKKRKKNSLFRRLTEMAENEDCMITQHEFCGDFVIGLDGMANRLFFYKKVENLEFAKSVNLREYKSCKTYNSNRTVGEKKAKYYVIDKLELIFYPAEKGMSEKGHSSHGGPRSAGRQHGHPKGALRRQIARKRRLDAGGPEGKDLIPAGRFLFCGVRVFLPGD